MQRSVMSTRSRVALLLIDVVNGFDFPGSGPIVAAAKRAAPRISVLADHARKAKVPVVYVNDNFGQWRSDFRATVDRYVAPDQPGHAVVELLRPNPDDYFVLKPRHSGFFSTVLHLLLSDLGVHSLVITGFATNQCVAFTAHDAHMLGYQLHIPADCTASNSRQLTRSTLRLLQELGATTADSTRINFSQLKRRARKRQVRVGF